MINAKRKGARNERRSRELLEAAGYRVTRAAGSLGEWDLIGLGLEDLVLVQVKSNRGPGHLERLVLTEFPCPPRTRKLIHVWRDRRRLPVVEEITGT